MRRTTRRPTGTIIAPPIPWRIRADHELRQRLDERATERPEREDHDRRAEHRSGAEAVREPTRERDEEGQAQQIGRDREVEAQRALAEVARDRGQRGRDHRRVHVLHEQRARDDHRNQIARSPHRTPALYGLGAARDRMARERRWRRLGRRPQDWRKQHGRGPIRGGRAGAARRARARARGCRGDPPPEGALCRAGRRPLREGRAAPARGARAHRRRDRRAVRRGRRLGRRRRARRCAAAARRSARAWRSRRCSSRDTTS